MTQSREIHPGVFVSSVRPDAWIPDPDVGGDMHILVEEQDGFVGMTRYETDPGRIDWTPPERESFLVLEGAATIEIQAGPTLQVGVGDLVSLPAGAVTTWHVTVPYRELWIFPRPFS